MILDGRSQAYLDYMGKHQSWENLILEYSENLQYARANLLIILKTFMSVSELD